MWGHSGEGEFKESSLLGLFFLLLALLLRPHCGHGVCVWRGGKGSHA